MKRALVSVTNKDGISSFCRDLAELGFELCSTGGTAKLLESEGLKVTQVASITELAEMFDGRVKTLHPKIHGAILQDRSNPTHLEEAHKFGIGSFDLVVVNLYQFLEKAVQEKLSINDAIHHIDIGGPAMLRAAAKNHQFCAPLVDPNDYERVIRELRDGGLADKTRQELAYKTFSLTAKYDQMIADHFSDQLFDQPNKVLSLQSAKRLRYGENPHQEACYYQDANTALEIVYEGKELSYNNYLDLDAAISLANDLDWPNAVAIIKHTNPCGVAAGEKTLLNSYQKALACDPKSAFGGIIATNSCLDADTAAEIAKLFVECIAAVDFEPSALETLKSKPNLRLVKFKPSTNKTGRYRSLSSGMLWQSEDDLKIEPESWQLVSEKAASSIDDLKFALSVGKHVKSNAIVFAKDRQAIATGAGQMSRIDAVKIAKSKAEEFGFDLQGSVMASDAFFPFRDCVDLAAKFGAAAIVQPGGSKRDSESIEAANEHGLALYFSGNRHFRH